MSTLRTGNLLVRTRKVQRPSRDDINKVLEDAEKMVNLGFDRLAVITAWAAVEAAMRMRLRAAGERLAGAHRLSWYGGTSSFLRHQSADEYQRLARAYELRNEIVHGFASPPP